MLTSACQPTAAPSDIRSSAHSAFPVGTRVSRSSVLFLGNAEPSLDEVMGDPMVRRLMDRDGVVEHDLRTLIGEIRDRLR